MLNLTYDEKTKTFAVTGIPAAAFSEDGKPSLRPPKEGRKMNILATTSGFALATYRAPGSSSPQSVRVSVNVGA